MTLILRGTTLNDEPMTQPLSGRFDERGGTVGRSDDATLTLPDPERMISRIQAQVLYRDLSYWIENVSTVSPILHNGRPLSTGMRVVLQEGDELRIGGYALQATLENDDSNATILRGRTGTPHLVNSPTAPKAAPARGAPAAPALPATPTPAATPASPPSPAPAARFPSPDASGTLAEPLPLTKSLANPTGTALSAGEEALWRGFLEGAEIDLPLPNGPSSPLMGSIGAMMKIAVEGIQRLMTMRARAKNEMQAEMTMIRVRDNNPLKFAPDAALALQMLLQPPARGFLAGPAALRAALSDLQAHQIGMTAGMRSVLEAVLDRLDPARLEALLGRRSVLDSLLPGRRRARLWELYLKQYGALREEAQDNFERFFGEVFREAYEAQVRNLDTRFDDATAPGGSKAGGKAR